MTPDASLPEAPFLSVVIPSYNREDLLASCLERLLPEAERMRGKVEIVVIDDGSTDGTLARLAEIAGRHPLLRYWGQTNGGPGAARNRGAQEARGVYLAFLDSDDFWMPWTLPSLIGELESAGPAGPAAVFMQARTFKQDEETRDWSGGAVCRVVHDTMLAMRNDARMPVLGSCNLVFRRDLFLRLGGFTTEVRTGEDTDFTYRAGEMGPVWSLTEPVLVAYRIATFNSLSGQSDGRLIAMRYLLKRNRAGLYPGPRDLRDRALAKTLLFAIRHCFARGNGADAYRLYVDGFDLLLRNRDWNSLLRLPLTPVLSLIRPANYRYRWRR